MEEKDYSLLRLFDLEAAKVGGVLVDPKGTACQYVAGPHPITKEIVVEFKGQAGFVLGVASDFRMAPLCWVEGRPVYAGEDRLFDRKTGKQFRVIGTDGRDLTVTGLLRKAPGCELSCHRNPDTELTWTPPKVKREGWVNIYPRPLDELVASVGHAHASKEAADAQAAPGRLACIRIEWEEPAGQEGGAQ